MDWNNSRGTATAGLGRLLEAFCDGKIQPSSAPSAFPGLAKKLAETMRSDLQFRADVLNRLRRTTFEGFGRTLLQIASEVPEADVIVALAEKYAKENWKFDQTLRNAIDGIALRKQFVAGSTGTYSLYSVDATALRARLFELARDDNRVAEKCLDHIDELRDQHGRPETEPRHPDLASGAPWPMVASGVGN